MIRNTRIRMISITMIPPTAPPMIMPKDLLVFGSVASVGGLEAVSV